MGFGNWSVWRWVGLLLVVLALIVAVVRGDGNAVASLIVLAILYVVANKACVHFRDAPTSVRIVWALFGLIIFWWTFFLGLVPVVDAVVEWLPEARAVQELDERLVSVADMPAPVQLYLALAFSIPTLLFIFGSGPFSQHGVMPGGKAPDGEEPGGESGEGSGEAAETGSEPASEKSNAGKVEG